MYDFWPRLTFYSVFTLVFVRLVIKGVSLGAPTYVIATFVVITLFLFIRTLDLVVHQLMGQPPWYLVRAERAANARRLRAATPRVDPGPWYELVGVLFLMIIVGSFLTVAIIIRTEWYTLVPLAAGVVFLTFHATRISLFLWGRRRRRLAYTRRCAQGAPPHTPPTHTNTLPDTHANDVFGMIRSAIEHGLVEDLTDACRVMLAHWPERFEREVRPYLERRDPSRALEVFENLPLRQVQEPGDMPELGGVELVLNAEPQILHWRAAPRDAGPRVVSLRIEHDRDMMLGADPAMLARGVIEHTLFLVNIHDLVLDGVGLAREDVLGLISKLCHDVGPRRLFIRGGSWDPDTASDTKPPPPQLSSLTLEALASPQRRAIFSWMHAYLRELNMVAPQPGWIDSMAHETYPGLLHIELRGGTLSHEDRAALRRLAPNLQTWSDDHGYRRSVTVAH